MRPTEASARPRIVLAGATACEILRTAESLAVFAVFERSLYLGTPSGDLVCLGNADLAPGPLMALCAPWPEPHRLPAAGSPVRMTPFGFLLEGRPYDLTGVQIWTPPPFPAPDLGLLGTALKRVASMPVPGETGLAALLKATYNPLLATWPPASGAEGAEGLFLREAGKGFTCMRAWLASGEPGPTADCENGVRALLGLGPGLTPSGDDALAGMLLALHALRLDDQCACLDGVVARLAPEATNAISRAHLRAAASGQGAAPVHAAIHALMEGGGRLDLAAAALSQIGHSSGWDTFTGIVLTLSAWLDAQAGGGFSQAR